MNIKLNSTISHINYEQWAGLLKNSPTSSFFQSQDYYFFLESLSFLKPYIFSVSENDILKGIIVGYIQKEKNPIKHSFTKRAIINGGPLLSKDISKSALKDLLDMCTKCLKHDAIFIEIRNFNDYSLWKDIFDICGFSYQPHYNFQIDTSSLSVVDSNMGKSRKRDVKLSIRDGATVIDPQHIDNIKDFYTILQDLYKTKIKTPLFPFEFFEKLFESKFGKFYLVRYQDRIIGGTACVCLDNKTVYEWFVCGKDGVYKNIYPSTLATYAGIQYAAQNGYKCFDMMGAGKPGDGGYGVRDFKAKFGGKIVEHGRFLHVNNKLKYFIGKIGIYIIKKLK